LFVGAALQALFPLFDASSKLNRLCSSLRGVCRSDLRRAVRNAAGRHRDRIAEIALWQHNMRVNASHYSYTGHPENPFHVGG
jgi:hypothetical protein